MNLVPTRLRPPVRGTGLIDRKRLSARVEDVRRRTLTFLMAPAGYGKSSTLCQWFDLLVAEGAAVGWLSLERIESDYVDFFRYLIAALRASRRRFGRTVEMLTRSTTPPNLEMISASFIDDLIAAGEDIFLFIDDFHLISDPNIGHAIGTILAHPPSNFHLVIASRESLPFRLSHLRLRDLLAEIDVDLLRFDHQDASDFLRLAGHSLSEAEIDTVVTMTEGWAAAIQLASISLTQRKANFFRLVSGEQEELSQFLADDVIKNLPAEMVDFLERTSILYRLNPDLCNALTGQASAKVQIDEIMRQNLFLFSLDDAQEWYRYHHFFAAFLRRRVRERDPELIPRLHRIASDWFAQRDLVEESFTHAIDASDYVRAATILEKNCPSLFYNGQLPTLLRWAKHIPDTVLKDYPRVRLEIAWSIILEWRFGEAARIISEVEKTIRRLGRFHGHEWRATINKIVLHRKMMLYLFMDDMPNVEAVITAGRESFPNDDPYLQGNLESCLAYARRELYQLEGIAELDAMAREYYERSKSEFVRVWHESAVGPGYFQLGNSELAVSSLASAMDIAAKFQGPVSALRAMPALLLAAILYEQNECREAVALLDLFGSDAEKMGFVDHLVAYYVTRSRLKFRSGDAEAAHEILIQARFSAERRGFERLLRWVDHDELRQTLAANDLSKAHAVVETMADPELAARLKPNAHTTSRDEALALTWGRATAALGNCTEAVRVLRLWANFARRRKALYSEVRVLIVLSICLVRGGKQADALLCMREAVGRAARPHFIRSFLDEGKLVESLLSLLFGESGDRSDPTSTFGRELLALFTQEPGYRTFADGESATATIEMVQCPPEALSPRESEVLRMVARGLSNKEIGRKLDLTEGSVKWYMQQIFTKLDVRRRLSAVRRAQQIGLL